MHTYIDYVNWSYTLLVYSIVAKYKYPLCDFFIDSWNLVPDIYLNRVTNSFGYIAMWMML